MRTAIIAAVTAAALCCGGNSNAQALPEELLFDSIPGSYLSNTWSSWRDARTSPPLGGVTGVLISTNTPFELTRIEALVRLEGAESLSNTVVEAVIFRGTNQLAYGLLDEPAFDCGAQYDGFVTNVVSLSPYNGDVWLASFTMDPYGWGTSRVLSIRSSPYTDESFAKLSLVYSSNAVAGVTTYAGNGIGNLAVQAGTPAMRVWRRAVRSEAPLPYELFFTDLEFKLRPGYQLGCATNLSGPWEWISNQSKISVITASTETSRQGFFKTRPDASP